MQGFDPTKRCRAKNGFCQNLVSKKAHPRRLCEEHDQQRKARRAATLALPLCSVPGCNERTGQPHGLCGRHRREYEERAEQLEQEYAAHQEKLDEKAEMFSMIGSLGENPSMPDLREVLRRIVDKVWGEG